MKRTLLTFALTAVGVFSANASAQASLETLMTHSISTAIGTHAGTALGRATNALANGVGNRTSSVVPRSNVAPQRTVGAQRARTNRVGANRTAPAAGSRTAATSPGNGSLIASIQGGERISSTPACAEGANSQAGNCATAVDAHPSVVTLPAPK